MDQHRSILVMLLPAGVGGRWLGAEHAAGSDAPDPLHFSVKRKEIVPGWKISMTGVSQFMGNAVFPSRWDSLLSHMLDHLPFPETG